MRHTEHWARKQPLESHSVCLWRPHRFSSSVPVVSTLDRAVVVIVTLRGVSLFSNVRVGVAMMEVAMLSVATLDMAMFWLATLLLGRAVFSDVIAETLTMGRGDVMLGTVGFVVTTVGGRGGSVVTTPDRVECAVGGRFRSTTSVLFMWQASSSVAVAEVTLVVPETSDPELVRTAVGLPDDKPDILSYTRHGETQQG